MLHNNKINKLAVFCGSRTGYSEVYKQSAENLADVLSNSDITMVYGGSKSGLMGIIANRMLKNGSKVIGIIPKSLVDTEKAHDDLTELHIVNSMYERKVLMCKLSDGFILLPGGSGSLDEFFEMFTLVQLGYHKKPCCILNASGYYDYLLQFLDHAVNQGFLPPNHRDMIIIDQSPDTLIDNLFEVINNRK
ncbi:TPA: TIGR00730 family Rossman fold protein [Legionella pneumophila]